MYQKLLLRSETRVKHILTLVSIAGTTAQAVHLLTGLKIGRATRERGHGLQAFTLVQSKSN